MEALFAVMAIGTVLSVAYLVAFESARGRARAWQAAAEQVGLTNVALSSLAGITTKVTGESGALRVQVERYQRGKSEHGTRVVIGGLGHLGRLHIRAEGMGSQIAKALGDREIDVGDGAFDDVAFIQGEPALVRALLTAPTRAAVQALLLGYLRPADVAGGHRLPLRASISDSELRLELRDRGIGRDTAPIDQVLPVVVDVGRQLLRPDDLPGRIAANNETEPLATVRLANLQTLASEFPTHAATRRALAAGLEDESVLVQFQAAIALGADGRPTLLRLVASEDADQAVVARAINTLGADCPSTLALEALRRARLRGRQAVVRACLERMTMGGAGEALDELAELSASDDAEVAAAAVSALGSVIGDRSERSLIAALGHAAADVRQVAAASLGKVGTRLAVIPLRDCMGEHRFDASLRSAARQAIAGIQSRATGASPGQLSLAEDTVGQVSLAQPDARGQVSLADAAAAAPSDPGESG
jgi:hypothetical protein